MASGNLRHSLLRESTQKLLDAGEQPHIEFKSQVVIGSVAKQVAAGANFIAFQPSAGVHTILFGVAEEDADNTGVTVGSIVGLATGGVPAGLDALQLQIEQTIHTTVRPQPNIVIHQENVSTRPILVLEVRPASAPHIWNDRWLMRGVAGIRAMTQDEALQIFKNQRLGAWIDEFEDSDPLKKALTGIRGSIDDLRYLQNDGRRSSPAADGGGLAGLEEYLQSLDQKVTEVIDGVEEVRVQATLAADNTGAPTAESIWWAVMAGRQLRMHTIYMFALKLTAPRVELVDALFVDLLGETTNLSEFPENLAEAGAYRSLRRAGSGITLEQAAVSELVAAAIWRANGLPARFGIGWLDDVRQSRDVLSAKSPAYTSGIDKEVGLLHLPNVSLSALTSAMGGTLSANGRVLTVATPNGAYRLAVPRNGDVWPIVFSPGLFIDDEATREIEETTEALANLATDSGGSCWGVEGSGLAIPTTLGHTYN
ncbi:ATP-binding protein [Cryobacterium lactosi]|uniref:ATP-binding protein n=1 Tax=Cryobacterium lactosi TaxID=1259202 RepID=A0A4R9BYC4_9MICO|nr:ATP-binding protein [Cryobacterium lactosi]TFD93996.1 ATP-binding protein [Cryobacterium lactosi]